MSYVNRLSPDDIDPATLGRSIMRALPRVGLVSLAVFGLTFGTLSLMAPRYQSEAQLTIDAKSGSANPFSDPKQQASADSTSSRMDKEAINTHIRSMLSPTLAAKIVNDLHLRDSPEFNSELGDVDMMGKLLRMVGLNGPRAGQSEQDRVLEAYFSKLDIYAVRESRFIGVRFTSANPQLAADIPNAIVDAYRQDLASRQVVETVIVQDALKPKIDQLTKEVASAEVAVEQFRGKTDSFNSGSTGSKEKQTLNEQQLGELTNELSRAQAARSESEARASAAKEMMKSGSGEALPDVQKSPLIQNLVQQRVRAERQIAEVSATLLPGHPRMKQLTADLAGLKQQINAEVAKVVDSVGKEAKVAAERETSIKKRLSELKVTVVNAGPDEAKLKMLVGDAQSKREELERLKAQYNVNTTRADSKSVPVEAQLISAATPSSVPVLPKKLPWSVLAAIATAILGLAMSVLKATALGARSGGAPRSQGPSGRSTMSSAETASSFASDATLTARPQNLNAIDAPVSGPTLSPAANATRGYVDAPSIDALVEHFLQVAPARGGYRTLVAGLTDAVDSVPTAEALAIGLMEAHQPTILVEWSGGPASVADQLGLTTAPGMAELITGDATFEDVITSLPGTDCHFIPAGRGVIGGEAGIDSDQLNLVLDALDEAYAHIVVTGQHDAVRRLFETIEGRFDTGVLVENPASPVPILRDPDGTFLGFEVTDIDLVRIAQVQGGQVVAPKSFGNRRLPDVNGHVRSSLQG